MPISAIDTCSEQHWIDVKGILFEAIDAAGFTPELVSAADDVGIIQKRIIQNLYENPMVICDVSAKNPNVMFELGLRLAFDKPTVIIKDDKTAYSFDTAPIEHLEYPRDLRFNRIVAFKQSLITKIRGTHEQAKADPHFSTFLRHFGKFKVAKLDTEEVSPNQFVLEELKEMRSAIARLSSTDRDRHSQTIDPDLDTMVQSALNHMGIKPGTHAPLSQFEDQIRDYIASRYRLRYPPTLLRNAIRRIMESESATANLE